MFDDIDDEDWSYFETAYGSATAVPNMLRKLITSNEKVFEDTMWHIYAILCHQGTIYEGTVKSVPFFWKILQYHIDKGQYKFAKNIFDFLRDIYKPDEYFFEPFGFDIEYIIKKYPKDITLDMHREMFKQWELILKFFKSDMDWLRNQTIFFLRFNLFEAEETVEMLRKAIPKERNRVILINLLGALTLLDTYLEDDSDLQLFTNFLHQNYPKDVRIAALLGVFILKKGNVPDSLAIPVSNLIKRLDDNIGERTITVFPPEPDPQEIDIMEPNRAQGDIINSLKEKHDEMGDYGIYHFYEIEETKMALYFVHSGANKILIPVLLNAFHGIPENMINPERACINVAETLLNLLFPNGFKNTLESSNKLSDYQRKFVDLLLETKKWKLEFFSEKLTQLINFKNKEELIDYLSKSPHANQFTTNLILTIFDTFGYHERKLDEIKNIIELELTNFNKKGAEIPEIIGNLTHLRKLKLSFSNIEEIPNFFGNLQALEELELRVYEGITLPPSIGELKALRKLEVFIRNLKEIPDFIGNLRNLTEFDIYIPNVEKLPDFFPRLENLERIYFHNAKKLNTLPDSFCNLPNIKSINIQGSVFFNLPSCFGNLKTLEQLRISVDNMSNLPESIGDLENLKKFELYKASIKALPNSIGKLKNLESLQIGSTQINSLPETIGDLESLTYLSLSYNKITKLPDSIANLKNLKSLYIKKNQLASFPSRLPPLDIFDYSENPIEKEASNNLGFLQMFMEIKLNQVEEYYKAFPEKWSLLYEQYNTRMKQGIIFAVGFASFAQYYMIKGVEIDNIHMVYDSMVKFADILENYEQLKRPFQKGELFHGAMTFLVSHEIKAESFIIKLSNDTLMKSNNPRFQHAMLNTYNKRGWFYLREGINLQFCLASGQFMREYGESKEIPIWQSCGKDLIASVYTLTEEPDKLKEAVKMFEEIKQVNEEWYSHDMLKLAQEKIKKLEIK